RRRDFSINAMAINLNPNSFGNLLDLYGGRRDIEHGLIRILYSMSFLDDPTRIFRAVRFASRFQFDIEQRTLFQFNQALEGDPFEPVSGDRLREELDLIFEENQPWSVVSSLFDRNVLSTLHEDFEQTESMEEWFSSARDVLAEFPSARSHPVYYGLLFHPIPEDTQMFLGRRLAFNRERMEVLRKNRAFSEIRDQLREAEEHSKIYQLLEDIGQREVLLIRMITEPVSISRKIELYLDDLVKVEPIIDGKDLQEWGVEPGPYMGDVLDELFYAQIDGTHTSREELKKYFEENVSGNVE
ncbi:MAG: hypothetical protein ABEJ65_03935, partial [bacterium]